MQSTTIASAFALNEKEVSILVDAAEASSLYAFLKKKNVTCTPPRSAITRPRRATRDSAGRVHIQEDALDMEIIAEGTKEDFQMWMHEWLFPNPGQ